jgi:alpha-mannosidase
VNGTHGWIAIAGLAIASSAIAQSLDAPAPEPAPARAAPLHDLSREKVLYAVGYAHLDTQWRWDYPTTIDRFILDTLDQNFERFEDHPGYVFNFTGSVRYEMMKEYYPKRYERLKAYIDQGRWLVSGSSVDEGDANVPSPESMIRQVLYGNEFFRREFGKESVDFMLPDCFGFPASMPSIWAHCGLLGFSTQKLTWGSAVGIPFEIGLWEGPDGRSVIAALDPGPYVGAIEGRVDTNPEWVGRVNENGERYGVWADYHYYGVGDMGGAPLDEDVANYLASIGNPDGQITVALAASDQMYKDITPDLRENLPRYKGDLLLTEHSAGTLTSQSYMKRWNRMAEGLADGAERASVLAWWLGAIDYPRERMERAWVRFLANQMHDILPGTSIPEAYTFSWNDEVVAMNQFAAMLTDGVGGASRALDTNTEGTPLVVFNPLAIAREDVVEATVSLPGGAPAAVRVFGPDGAEAPSQVLGRDGDAVTVLFLAEVAPVSVTVFEVRAAERPFEASSSLRITERTVENEHVRVEIDDAGDVVSIVDTALDRELLAAPARLVFTYEKPQQWPAWNMDWADRQKPPLDAVDGPATIRIVEDGPVRIALEVTRAARNSVVTQRLRLTRGDAGRSVEFDTDIDWQSAEVALKASFPLTVSNPMATYNWGLGTIERGNNEPVKYEVPSHEWIDLTDASGDYGVSILEDSKYGSDKPADNEVRLTLLYTPGVRNGYLDQHSQDWGRHEMRYALYPHAGDWRDGRSEWRGRRLNQPLRAFTVPKRDGGERRSISLASVNTAQVDIRAIKAAERTDLVVVRLQELWGRDAAGVKVSMVAPILEAWEVDGQERLIGPAQVVDGALALDMTPYSPRSFAVRLAPTGAPMATPSSTPLVLPYNADVISTDDDRADGAFDAQGRTIPSEMLPESLMVGGVAFVTGPREAGALNALAAQGQVINLPPGEWTHISMLLAATDGVQGDFRIGDRVLTRTIQSWTGFVGQWDDRIWDRPFEEVDYRTEGEVIGFRPGFIKRDEIAWFATHRHHADLGNEAYRFSYLYRHDIPVPPGATALTLPDNPRIRILAATATNNPNAGATPAAPLYDTLDHLGPLEVRHEYPAPPTPVFEGVEATGAVQVERAASIAALTIASPSSSDDASGLAFRVVDPEGAWTPHWASGAVGGALPRLNDGEVARHDDDTERCVWWDTQGRFVLDMGSAAPIESIRVFSWHRSDRAPQWFSVWGSPAETPPDAAFAHGGHDGWTLLGVVDSRELGQGGVHASVTTPDGRPYRHLLFIAEDVGQGTFFMEVDIDRAD